jgi:thioredoxin reductase (NADPH)
MNDDTHDIITVGGGPGGLTASIYTSREGFDTLLLEKGLCGGLPATTDLIENYPGFPVGINGMELIDKFKEQALRFGTNILEFKEVKTIEPAGKRIIVKTVEEEYNASAVIVASGSIPKKLNIPGEEKYSGKGVSYCATCDGPLYRNKDVAIIGCGNSGLQEGEALLKYVKSITFIEFLPYMTAEKILQERLQKSEKTRFLLNHMLTSINGDTGVNSVTVKKNQTGKEKQIDVSGVFIYVGFLPNSEFLKDVVELDSLGYIVSNEKMETSVPGIYAVGDVRSKKVRQIDVACGEGTIAAIYARDYINELI